MEIVGPSGDVPIKINAKGYILGGATFVATGPTDPTFSVGIGFNVAGVTGGDQLTYTFPQDRDLDELSLGEIPNTFEETGMYMMSTNKPYTVSMFAEIEGASAYGARGLGGSYNLSALVDPIFAIAPTVTDPDQYKLIFSDGIENGALGAPEASTWVMMILGLASLGYAGARRSRRSS